MKCKYENCCIKEKTERDCSSQENCQTYKFYEKYPDYLGVGAMMIPLGGLEDDIRQDWRKKHREGERKGK